MALLTKAGDLWGKKRVMLLAAVVFGIGTLICAVTASWPLFLVGRGWRAWPRRRSAATTCSR
jgi:MFS family permease